MSMPEMATALDVRVRHDDTVPVLVLPDDVPFERLREHLKAHLAALVGELGGAAVRIDLGERELQLFDIRRLLHLLRDGPGIEVTGLYVRAEAIHQYAERELKLKLFPTDGVVADEADDDAADEEIPGLADTLAALAALADDDEVDEPAPEAFEPSFAARKPVPLPEIPEEPPEVDDQGGRRVLTVHRTLRSGTVLKYDGDIHVFGDVNAGAQIQAGGDIVVFGKLRGVVHAGAHGDEEAFILALDFTPTQIRIGRQIAIAPARPATDALIPEVAQVVEGQIVIEPYRGRLSRR